MRNWKTTAAGVTAGVCEGCAGQFPEYAMILRAVAALAIGLMGIFAKDFTVSGDK